MITTIKMRLLLILAALILPSSAHAASGSAFIPHWESQYITANNFHATYIFVSNITDTAVSVSLTLYDESGAIVSDDGSPTTGALTAYFNYSSYNDNVTGASATFDIPANSTARLTVLTAHKAGHGKISWTQNSDNVVALFAYTQREWYVNGSTTFNGRTYSNMEVNEGKPF